MTRVRWWGGMVLCGAVLWGCGDGDKLPNSPEVVPTADSGVVEVVDAEVPVVDAGTMEVTDAEVAEMSPEASTMLAPVEASFTGQAQQASSAGFTMVSRLAAPMGGGVSAVGTSYRMTTGVLALQEAEQ